MKIHILGICGTFMGGLAQILVEKGHQVSGADQQFYPPMSDQLQRLGVEMIQGYDPTNLPAADLFVIVGTTMQVQPAASLLLSVPIDAQTVYIDVAPDVDKGINLVVLKEKATVGMQLLVDDYLPY